MRVVRRPGCFSVAGAVLLASPAAQARSGGAKENRPPVVKPVVAAGVEDEPITGQLDASDADGDALRFRAASRPKNGAVVVDEATGRFTYTPAKDFAGEDAFKVDVRDDRAKSTAEVRVTVAPVNDAPAASPASLAGDEDQEITSRARAVDVDGDALSYAVARAPGHGSVRVDERTGEIRYAPAQDFHGRDSFGLRVSDGQASSVVDVDVVVKPRNDAPAAEAALLQTTEDEEVSGRLTGSDVDGDGMTYAIVASPTRGAVVLADPRSGEIRYRPTRDAHGEDTFTFSVSDGKAATTATVRIAVAPVNDAPTARPLALATKEDVPARGAVRAVDVDGDRLSFRIARPPAGGAAEIDERSGAVLYTPKPDFHGADAFTIEISDHTTTVSLEVPVEVSPVNDAPTASAATFAGEEDAPIESVVSATDVDGDALAYAVSRAPGRGRVEVDAKTGAFRYEPARDVHGADAFTVVATDGRERVEVPVAISLAPKNDVPVLQPARLSTREDQPAQGALRATDVDQDALSFRLAAAPTSGAVELNAKTGALTYVPGRDFFGADAFTIEVSDGTAVQSAEVRVDVAAVNDPPTASGGAFAVDEDEVVEGGAAAADVDGDGLRWRVTTRPRRGELVLDERTGAFRYRPARDFHGADAFAYEASDGTLASAATVALEVRPRNDPPAVRAPQLSTREDVPARGAVAASDVDGDPLVFRVKEPPAKGEVALDARTGAFTYTPSADRHGDDRFVVEVDDGAVVSSAEVAVVVAATPDAPRVSPSTIETDEDAPVAGSLPAFDPDQDRLAFRLRGGSRLGAIVLEDAASGRFRLTPAQDVHGEEEIPFEVTDGTSTVAGVVRLRVRPVNDAPLAAAVSATTEEDTPVSVDLIGSDVDGDALTFEVVAQPARGRAVLRDPRARKLVFEPAADHEGTVTFEVVAHDGQARSAPAQVRVDVQAKNDAPVAQASSISTLEDAPVRGQMVAADAEGDPLTFRIVRPPSRGEVVVEDRATGAFVYKPGRNLNGPDSFAFAVVEPSGQETTATVAIQVDAVNDPPTAIPTSLRVPRAGRLLNALEGYDPEGGPLRFRVVEQPATGRVEVLDAKKGTFSWVGRGKERGRTSFRFVIDDGELTSAPATVDLEIR